MKIIVSSPVSAMELLVQTFPDSPRTRIKQWLEHGVIRCEGKAITRHSHLFPKGAVVVLEMSDKRPNNREGAPFPYQILYEDGDLLAIEKPIGINTSSMDNSPSVYGNLNSWYSMATKKGSRVLVVHRLDKEVSGVLLFAKNAEALASLKDNWKQVSKTYTALVEGRPKEPEGTISSWLMENKALKMYSVPAECEGAKLATTHWKTIAGYQNTTLVSITLDTGRKNQIRVHLSDLGCPIVGDRKYGAKAEGKTRVHLHAIRLELPHPTDGRSLVIESQLPQGFLGNARTPRSHP